MTAPRRIRDFQLYLLAKMSAAELVQVAVVELEATLASMSHTAAAIAAEYGLDEAIHPAAAYPELLGAPSTTRVLREGETSARFVGSRRDSYALPLWPGVQFVVNAHPDGWAWGEQFDQADEIPFRSPNLVQPWHWTRAKLTHSAASVATTEEWTDYYEGKFTFADRTDGLVTFDARFDLGLLQSWVRVGAAI